MLRLAGLSRSLRSVPLAQFVRMASTATNSAPGPMETSIRARLEETFSPKELTITNDSWQHRHHAAMKAQRGGSGETHFTVHVISDAFAGKTTLQRHRMIYTALSDELEQGVHALSLKARTVEESAVRS